MTMPVPTTHGDRNPVEALAEEFLDRKRRGEPVTPEEYAADHHDLAEEILAVFPALLLMEDLGASSGGSTGSGSRTPAGGSPIGGASGRLGDFRLLREVGRGGMGIVYEAWDESLRRHVALKILSAGALANDDQVRRFEREARSAARLHHTHIVPVFGVGQHEGVHFYVMQFIRGQGLDAVLQELRRLRDARASKPFLRESAPIASTENVRQRVAGEIAESLVSGRFVGDEDGDEAIDGRPSVTTANSDASVLSQTANAAPSDTSSSAISSLSGGATTVSETDRRYARGVARVGLQVAEALAYADVQGILHRDIKPSNLLLDRDGNVWIADFGLAKAVGGEDLTHTGDIVGTVRYMAPERFQGSSDAQFRPLRAGADPLRDARPTGRLRRVRPRRVDPAGVAGVSPAVAPPQSIGAARPGDDHPQGNRARAVTTLCLGNSSPRGSRSLPGRPTTPGSEGVVDGARLEVDPAQPRGRRAGHAGRDSDDPGRRRLLRRGLPQRPAGCEARGPQPRR